jgi:hypothetical protein
MKNIIFIFFAILIMTTMQVSAQVGTLNLNTAKVKPILIYNSDASLKIFGNTEIQREKDTVYEVEVTAKLSGNDCKSFLYFPQDSLIYAQKSIEGENKITFYFIINKNKVKCGEVCKFNLVIYPSSGPFKVLFEKEVELKGKSCPIIDSDLPPLLAEGVK